MSPSGWQLIEDEIWARLARVAELPPRARFELEQIIGEERLAYPWKKGALPSEINTELKKLKASADRLYEGLRTVSIGAAHALMSVNAPEHGLDDDPFLKAFETTPDDFAADLELFGSYGAAFEVCEIGSAAHERQKVGGRLNDQFTVSTAF